MMLATALNEIYDGMRVRHHADVLLQAVKGMKYVGTEQKREIAKLLGISEDALEEFYLELLDKGFKVPPMVVG